MNLSSKIIFLYLVSFMFIMTENGGAESLNIKNRSANPTSGIIIGENSDWLYVQDNKTGNWTKLIPGRCPQWLPDGTRFYYFLDVGYDGARCELWSADANGESRLRQSKSDYFIDRSPVVSKDGKKLAYHYSAPQADGGFEKVLVICLAGLGEESEASVVLKEPQFTQIESIAWVSSSKLDITVKGQVKHIDVTCKKKKALHLSEGHLP